MFFSRFSSRTGVSCLPRLLVIGIVTGLFAAGVIRWSKTAQPISRVVMSSRKPLGMNRCAECHQEQFESFAASPHRRTLTPAADASVRARFSGQAYQWPAAGPQFRFETHGTELWMKSDAYPDPIRIDWIFGSGRHAQTPVSIWTNAEGKTELLEHAVSWYPAAGLDLTLGFDENQTRLLGIDALGRRLEHAVSMDCFECHVTHLPQNSGRIDEGGIIAGVLCARCHPGGEKHIAAAEQGGVAMQRWSSLSPLESINRCGECHRRADQLAKVDLDPDRKVLIRFAPVGLAMSACFQHQQDSQRDEDASVRLDCLTCHDPHRPSEADPRFYTAKCLSCHGTSQRQAPVCSSQPMTSQCLECHMPKVEVQRHLFFTDHWIRIRQTPDTR
jgi:hypothetical protein